MDAMSPPFPKHNKWLPWIAFLVLPLPALLVDLAIVVGMSSEFKNAPFFLKFIGTMLNFIFAVLPFAWLMCFILYLVPGQRDRGLYCRIPMIAIGIHIICSGLVWMAIVL